MHRHPIDAVSLVAGAIFAVIGVTFLLPGMAVGDLWAPELWPIVLVVLGVWLVASTLRRSRPPKEATSDVEAAGQADGEHDGEHDVDEDDAAGEPGDDEASASSSSGHPGV